MKWQPIETAPKETAAWLLLGYYPDYMEGKCQGGKPAMAFWDPTGEVWIDNCGNRLRSSGEFSPTHWMSLPDAP